MRQIGLDFKRFPRDLTSQEMEDPQDVMQVFQQIDRDLQNNFLEEQKKEDAKLHRKYNSRYMMIPGRDITWHPHI